MERKHNERRESVGTRFARGEKSVRASGKPWRRGFGERSKDGAHHRRHGGFFTRSQPAPPSMARVFVWWRGHRDVNFAVCTVTTPTRGT